MAIRVLKFGGTSVATAERLAQVAAIVERAAAGGPVVVVVSALGGVTNELLAAARLAAARDEAWRSKLAGLRERHAVAAAGVAADPTERTRLLETVEAACGELAELLHGAFLLRETTPRALDRVASLGERLAAPLAAAALRARGLAAAAVDARELLVTDRRFGAARVDRGVSDPKVRAFFANPPWSLGTGGQATIPVVTGFIAATAEGETTTLGRGGSDLTAALLGAALAAAEVEIWTDVPGVLSADPRLVPEAFSLPELTYEELMELSHFGAKVVYPPTVHPARAAGIPLRILDTFQPEHPGTRVSDSGTALADDRTVRGLASIRRVALVRLQGDGMVGVPGIAARLFGALARQAVNVILITQASSEHSICLAVAPEDLARAVEGVEEEFRLERAAELVDPLAVEPDLAVVAAVGDGMRERPGVAGRVFAVLGREGINVRAIAQGSSERNISLVIASADEERALRALHHELFAAPPARVAAGGAVSLHLAGGAGGTVPEAGEGAPRPAAAAGSGEVAVYVAGRGNVGRELLARLGAGPAFAAAAAPVVAGDTTRPASGPPAVGHCRLAGVAGRRELWLATVGAAAVGSPGGVGTAAAPLGPEEVLHQQARELPPASAAFDRTGSEPADPLARLVAAALADPGPRVFVDVTASDATTAYLPELLAAGCAVVAANKRPFAGSLADWQAICAARAEGARRLGLGPHDERALLGISTTAGAGLPFAPLLETLQRTGDRPRRIEAVLSGTLSFLFARLATGEAFSVAVAAAQAAGFTEPDPREDLGGADVGRKLVILARAAGVELADDAVRPVPLLAAEPWSALPLATWWQRLPELDAELAATRAEAAARGRLPTYLARLELCAADGTPLAVPRATVGPCEVASDHPVATLAAGENLLVVWTERYRELPLVVRGPGAGPQLTAAGVHADLELAAAALLGGRRRAGSAAHP
jgi:aspartokinase/homoserine dehydrogenase 1